MKLTDLGDDVEINPSKIYYKIGDVSELLEIKPSVLRFWEGEFNVKTGKSKSNQRLYNKEDILKFLKIKKLLYEKRFTVEGAKKKIKEEKTNNQSLINPENKLLEFRNLLILIREELKSIVE